MGCTSSKALAEGTAPPERAPPPPAAAPPAPTPVVPGPAAAPAAATPAPAPAPVNATPAPAPALASGRASVALDAERRSSVASDGGHPAPAHPQLSPQQPRRSANALAANPHLAYLTGGGGRHRDHHGGSAGAAAGGGGPAGSGSHGAGGAASGSTIKRTGSLGHSIDKRALPELPTAMVLAAALNDVAYFHKVFSLLAAKTVRDAAKARASSSAVGFSVEGGAGGSSRVSTASATAPAGTSAGRSDAATAVSDGSGGESSATQRGCEGERSGTGAGAAPTEGSAAGAVPLLGPAAVLSPIPSSDGATSSSTMSGDSATAPQPAAAPAPQPPAAPAASSASSRPPIHGPSTSTTSSRLSGIIAPMSRESSFASGDVGLSLGGSGSMTPLTGSFYGAGTPSTPKPAPSVCVSTLACFIDSRMHGDNLLQIAAAAGAVDVLTLFLDSDPSLTGITRAQTGNTLLHYAALGPAHVAEIFKSVRSHLLHNPDLLSLESEVLHAADDAAGAGAGRIEVPSSRSGSFASLAEAGVSGTGGGATPGLPRTWSGVGFSGTSTPLPPGAAAAAATASSSSSIKMTGLQYLQSVLAAQAAAVGQEYAAAASSGAAHSSSHHGSGFGSLTRRLGLHKDKDREGTIQAPFGGRSSSGNLLASHDGGERPSTPHADGHSSQHHPACSFAFAFAGASGTATPPSTPATGVPASASALGTSRFGFGFSASSSGAGSGSLTPSGSGTNLAGMVSDTSRRRSTQATGNGTDEAVGLDVTPTSSSAARPASALSIKKPNDGSNEASGSTAAPSVLTAFKGPRLQLAPPPAAEASGDTPRAASASCGLLLPAGAGGPAFLDLLLLRPASATASSSSSAPAFAFSGPVAPSASSPHLVALVELTDLYHRFPARSIERTVAALLARGCTVSCKRNTFGKSPLDIAASHAHQINPESTSSALSTGNILVEGGFWDRVVHPIHPDWEDVRRTLAAAAGTQPQQ